MQVIHVRLNILISPEWLANCYQLTKWSNHYLLYLYSSAGQSEKALLARIHTLEQEKAMLSEQVESAQAVLRSYLEGTQHRVWEDSNYDYPEMQVATCFSNDLTDYTYRHTHFSTISYNVYNPTF